MAEYGPTVVHEPKGEATATFIMLHGLGDTGEQLRRVLITMRNVDKIGIGSGLHSESRWRHVRNTRNSTSLSPP